MQARTAFFYATALAYGIANAGTHHVDIEHVGWNVKNIPAEVKFFKCAFPSTKIDIAFDVDGTPITILHTKKIPYLELIKHSPYPRPGKNHIDSSHIAIVTKHQNKLIKRIQKCGGETRLKIRLCNGDKTIFTQTPSNHTIEVLNTSIVDRKSVV